VESENLSLLGNGAKKSTKKSAKAKVSSRPEEEKHEEGAKTLVSASTVFEQTLAKLEVKAYSGVNDMSSTAAKAEKTQPPAPAHAPGNHKRPSSPGGSVEGGSAESIAKRGRGRPRKGT
jgi:hypothetical protein